MDQWLSGNLNKKKLRKEWGKLRDEDLFRNNLYDRSVDKNWNDLPSAL